MERIEERISGAKLTARDRKVLDYMMKNKETACFMAAAEIAELLEVSASCVVRLSGKLGFPTYYQFKRALQEEVAKSCLEEKGEPIPYERIKEYENLTDREMIEALTQNIQGNMARDLSGELTERLKEAAAMISSARRVYLAGFRAVTGFANSFAVMLNCIRPDVYVIPAAQPTIDFLADLTPGDLIVPIAFHRYSKDTLFVAEMGKQAGCRILAITDSLVAPVARGADLTIPIHVESFTFFNSYVSLAMVMDLLTGLVSKQNKGQNEERRDGWKNIWIRRDSIRHDIIFMLK